MKIKELIIYENSTVMLKAIFKDKVLIYSSDNSMGKTSFVRFILHSLLFKISSTQNINMNDYDTSIVVENDEGQSIMVYRTGSLASIRRNDKSITKNIGNDEERIRMQANLFGIDSKVLLNNLLGTFYIDQDVGWSMANKGDVTASYNSFDVVDFILAFSNEEQLEQLQNKITFVTKEINKYDAIKSLATSDLTNETNDDYVLDDEIKALLLEKARLTELLSYAKQNLRLLDESYKSNENFLNVIDDYRILVRNGNDKFVLRRDNIVDSNIDLGVVKASLSEEKMNIKKLESDIKTIEKIIETKEMELVNIEDLSNVIVRSIKKNNTVSVSTLEAIITGYKKEKSNLEEEKRTLAKQSDDIFESLREDIVFMAKQLDIGHEYIDKVDQLVKLRNVSLWSGIVLSKAVLCYRYAYLKLLDKKLGLKMPFIIDSPGASELTEDNSYSLTNKVLEQLPDHQIIVSTVHNKIKNKCLFDKIMVVEGKLFQKVDY